MLDIDFDNSKPIYSQIIDEIKRALARKALKPGDKLPSQRELAQSLKVNPNTIQRAYRDMELLGLVETLRGQGTFIRKDDQLVSDIKEEMMEEIVETFVSQMQSLGCDSKKILRQVEEKITSTARQ